MQLLLFLTICCSTAPAAGIPPPDPDLSDLQKLPSLSTIVADNDLTYSGPLLSEFASPSDTLTSSDFGDQDNDRSSINLIDPYVPSSSSVASEDLGEPEIQTFSPEIVDSSNSKGDEALLTTDLSDSNEISLTDPSFINSIAMTGPNASGRICRPGNPATLEKKDGTSCINLDILIHSHVNPNTPDKGTYTPEQEEDNNKLLESDERWEYRQKLEDFSTLDNEDGWDSCEHVPGGRKIAFCCMGPFRTAKFNHRLKPRRTDKRFDEYTLNVGNCVLNILGRPRCIPLRSRVCCAKYGIKMRWGWEGVNCVPDT